MVAIIGKSGSGKSTILNIIGLLENYNSGKLKLFDKENIKINSKESMLMLRNKIGYLFQNYALIDNESVDYNLEIPLVYSKYNKKEKQNL